MQRYEFKELVETYIDSGSIVYYPNLAVYYAFTEFINALREIPNSPPSGYYDRNDPIYNELADKLDEIKRRSLMDKLIDTLQLMISVQCFALGYKMEQGKNDFCWTFYILGFCCFVAYWWKG